MRIQTGDTFNCSGLFSTPGSSPSVSNRNVQDVAVIDLRGPLVGDLPVNALRDQIAKVLHQRAKDVVINLTEVPYADSYGLDALAGAYNWIRGAGGRIKFFAVSDRLIHTLQRLHLDTVLSF